MEDTLYLGSSADRSARVPIKMWIKDIEDTALDQAANLSNLPFAFRHISIMPDCHAGYGMPIGSILAAENYVVPNAVGVDIGCGMTSYRLDENFTEENVRQVYENVVEFCQSHNILSIKRRPENVCHMDVFDILPCSDVLDSWWDDARLQLGTLGGGNHFIEFQKDIKTNRIFLTVHSGSRNLGKKVADHYNFLAKAINEENFSSVPSSYDLAFLKANTALGQSYIKDMIFCQEYAKNNRRIILEDIMDMLGTEAGWVINCCHNFARLENHFGKNVYVHRKGATYAGLDELAIIPGSQGTNSFIVRGLGNIHSFKSCSHGAGRKMSRNKAKAELDLQREKDIMDSQNILCSLKESNLDEAPGAYKDINEVMELQKDLVSIEHVLQPVAVIKN